MGLKAAVQALKKAEPLKDKVQRCKDLLNDNDAWMYQRQLRNIYQQVLILDLEYALDRKVEQELWNLGFKNYIAMLQSQAQDRRNPKRKESQAMLTWCLEAASGFYLTLLQEICAAFDLDLPFRRKGYVYGCISPWKAVEKLSTPHKSSCFYICQYCLVHLGDIARYRYQSKQAELFYRHAVSVSPSSGQPYNQLALLEASRGDKLGTVFHYVRSVALKHPFPVATTNLAKTLSTALNDNSFNVEGKTKLSSQEYIAVFLKFHGVIYNLGDLRVATTYVKLLNDTLTALVATESFSAWRLVQMLVINLYALQHAAGMTSENMELMKTDQLSNDENISRNCILDLIAGSLSALLLPVYTIKNSILTYFALPTIKLCLDWIHQRPTVLEEAAFTSRLQIWPSFCVLLNGLQSCVIDFDYSQYAKVPLPEDRGLQGFLPLEKSFETLQFTNTDLEDDAMVNKGCILRAIRIIHLGKQLAQHQVNGAHLITLGTGDKSDETKFISANEDVGLSSELMKELEELSLNKEKQSTFANSPVPSETASSKGSSEIDSLIAELGLEKRGGILKPQGSLERSRDSNDPMASVEINSVPTSARRPRQNVAMQAIMRRAENEQKQVTFKNVSPVIVDETDKTKSASASLSLTSGTPTTVRINNAKNIVISSSTTNISCNAPPVQTRQPLIPTTHLKSTQQPKQSQLQQLEQQLKASDNHLNNILPYQQPRDNLVLPTSIVNQYPITDMQNPVLQGPAQTPAPPGLTQFSVSQQQQQQQGPLPPNPACFPNQTFNVQTPQFNKNFMANPSASLQQYAMAGSMQAQYAGSQPPVSQGMPFPNNLSQNRMIQSQQQQQRNFGAIPPQNNTMLAQGLNLNPANQQQTSMGITMQPNPLSMLPQNMLPRPLNGLNLQNPMNIPTSSLANYPSSMSDVTISSTATTGMQQQQPQLNFAGANFGQATFPQQAQLSTSTFGSGQQQQFNFPNQSGMNKNQQSVNNYPMFHGYDGKDYNPWKDPQAPQPPVNWWASNNMPGGQQMIPQQGLAKDISGMTGKDIFQNWAAAATSSITNQRMNNVPLSPGNNYNQNPMQPRLYPGRNNFEDMRAFDMDQKQPQSSATSNTYSLFSGNSWGMNGQLSTSSNLSTPQQDQIKVRQNQQSLWSGPGPSPLERLLEQQKSLRDNGT
ncbi:nonsense-mediated mRNA decay factor SMG7-like [Phymastichus coffea]|uniref:nonsense-mediated mRNA decay factor SMG7-like n=1 Tax=Phymastichus coffea TaxID=108790 RepID=UPI00273C0192|nr:nonsense-mediated mRNA decay factor SMG7-like [Phymastichus coffea]